ncbi:MAG: ABC transporter ATP-binding protein [Gemmatimonadota bacterium]|nr:ABC transporter ATP-binding protein [Gemmatimonadota bacterium]
MVDNDVLLRVNDLKTFFDTDEGEVHAVDGVSFDVERGKTLGIVGESGCGKSMTAFSILRLIPQPAGRVAGGEIWYRNQNLLKLSDPQIRGIRGNHIAMIFQEPMTSLNPVFTIGEQIAEAVRLHQNADRKTAWKRSVELLDIVGMPLPAERARSYPHELSGGMRQRAMIAMAISCNPAVLIADEPTTALDVTIQAQILDVLRRLQEEYGMALILITHDLGVVAEMAHEVVVMYAGQVVEQADVRSLFTRPLQPYTRGLLHSVPTLTTEAEQLSTIEGVVPDPARYPEGCRFGDRCSFVVDSCRQNAQNLAEAESGHFVRCTEWDKVEQSVKQDI